MHELDVETCQDILDAFHELYQDIEITLNSLRENDEIESLNRVFRAIHNIKGHAGMFQLQPIVDFAHALEDLAGALRSKQFTASRPVCECILLGVDRLKDLHYRELRKQQYPNLNEHFLQERS